ncbi:MAG: hypothetical protein SH850_14060 [Planctomycetaceae bacterium]|nr:hypothetical protein [Planctomycetaceae bacterium]
MRRFTVAGAAKLFDLDPKTVRSVIGDLVWLNLIERVDFSAYSEIKLLPLTADHLKLFRPMPTGKAAGKVVEPMAKKPRTTITQFKLGGDRWDDCRRACEGQMAQSKAEEIFQMAKRLGESPGDFLDGMNRVKAVYDDRVVAGKVAAGVFGGYLKACYQKRIDVLEEQEREERKREYLSSPEFQEKLAARRKAAEADPTHELFIASDEAIHARVDFGNSPVGSYQALDRITTAVHKQSRAIVATKNLRLQEEIDEIGRLKGKIIKHALGSLNHFYQQPIKATPDEFQQALNAAASNLEPKMPPIFEQAV